MMRVGGQEMQMVMPGKRPRSPYVKWSKEEDDLLAEVRWFLVLVLSSYVYDGSVDRRLRNTGRSGTWCKRRCRVGDITRCGSAG